MWGKEIERQASITVMDTPFFDNHYDYLFSTAIQVFDALNVYMGHQLELGRATCGLISTVNQ